MNEFSVLNAMYWLFFKTNNILPQQMTIRFEWILVINAILNMCIHLLVNVFFIIHDIKNASNNHCCSKKKNEEEKKKEQIKSDMERLVYEFPGEFDQYYGKLLLEGKIENKMK